MMMRQNLYQSILWLLIASCAAAKVLPLPVDGAAPVLAYETMNQLNFKADNAHGVSWEHVNKTCLTHDCDDALNLQHLWHIERFMRHDVDPCVDFHAYACGNWRNVLNTIGTESESPMAVGGRQLNERYVDLFERLLHNAGDPLHREVIYGKLLQYYSTCKNSERNGQKLNVAGYLERMVAHGNVPQVQAHWLELLARAGHYGYSGHFIQLEVHQQNATAFEVTIQPHNVALRANLTADVHAALRNYTNLSFSMLRTEFEKLEMDLSAIIQNATQQNAEDNDTYLCYLLTQLSLEVPELDWQRMLTLQFGSRFSETHKLLVDNVDAIRQVLRYLNNADPELLMLYTLTRLLNYLQAQPHNPLHSVANGYNCVRHMRKTLYLAMNYAFERAHYATRRAASDSVIYGVFDDLKREFAHTLTVNAMQLPENIVREMHAKVHTMRLNIGNMPINASQTFYDNCFAHLHVADNFYENHLQSLLHYYAHLNALEHAHSVDNSIWYTFNHHAPNMPDNIDATPYFYCLSNIIIIPYGYLQLPFYDERFWPALLYGDLANTLGHELLHAFDSYFIDYDPAGNMRDFSTQLEQNVHYMANLRCLNDSARAETFLNERIADISGTRLALHTYMREHSFRRANGRLYFLQFAQFFCGDDSDFYHDSGSRRLNYTLAHTPEFAEVFDCAAATPMNPAQRCELW